MSALKNAAEMERIRAADAKLKAQALKAFVPEPNHAVPVAYFQVDRYDRGSFRGMFVGSMLITEDAQGKKLKTPIKKVVADGVDLVVLLANIETALRRKVFR